MRVRKRFFIFAVMVAIVFTSTASAKSLGYRWSNKYSTIYFYCGFNSVWTNAIQAGMNSWNSVKEISTSKTIVPMYVTTSSSKNKIYTTSNQTWIAKMIPTYSGSNLSKADVAFNNGDYTFSVGAAANKYDIQSIAVHEFGHAIGLAHCHEIGKKCSSSSCSKNIMQPTSKVNNIRRGLTSYDKESKQVEYYN